MTERLKVGTRVAKVLRSGAISLGRVTERDETATPTRYLVEWHPQLTPQIVTHQQMVDEGWYVGIEAEEIEKGPRNG